MLEPPVDENGNIIPARPNQLWRRGRDEWQGSNGRIAQVFDVWSAAVLRWEWDKIDKVKLVDEFARPITRHLASSLVGSLLSFQFLLVVLQLLGGLNSTGLQLPIVGEVGIGLLRLSLFRVCMALHVIFQLCSAFHTRLEQLYEAAHSAARDDRYLVGEVLMNHSED